VIKKLKVGPFVYKVKYFNGAIDERQDPHTGTFYTKTGEHDYLNLCISVSKNPDLQDVTLFHEIIHAILTNAGYMDQNELESLVECIAIGFYQVLKDNKSLRDLIGSNFKLTR
jgi:hypothetical protein